MTETIYQGSDGCPLFVRVIDRPRNAGQVRAPVVYLHAGGPDHHSMMPLAELLSDQWTAILPDIRGYGRSVCTDPACHTWDQYARDVISLLDFLSVEKVMLVGAGIGTTIALRTSLAYPERIEANVLISVEDIEDDDAKKAEMEFLEAFGQRARTQGIEAAWEPILSHFPPIVGALVRDAIPRSTAASIAAAAAISYDRSFRSVEEIAVIRTPTLVVPGIDTRHPAELAAAVARIMPNGELSDTTMAEEMHTAADFGKVFAPVVRRFLGRVDGIAR